jgi:hypothetical protein
MIDYSDCVLNNWELIGTDGDPITADNIRILNRFTGLIDEEWFMKTHVLIECAAARDNPPTPFVQTHALNLAHLPAIQAMVVVVWVPPHHARLSRFVAVA